jgi:hypothetical protein
MSARGCDRDELQALARGELEPSDVERVNRHVAGCEDCAGELAWLRAERRILSERERAQPELPGSLWAGIEARIGGAAPAPRDARPARRSLASWLREKWLPAGFAAGLATAAVVLIWMAGSDGAERGRQASSGSGMEGSASEQPVGAGDAAPGGAQTGSGNGMAEAERAGAEAERAHLAAIDALERVYVEQRARLDPARARQHDQELRNARESYARERVAATDLDARLLLLDAYSEHRRLLQSLVQELEVRQ